ncbi:hypothetical protein [Saccharopolyspora gloriosae]|uniref:hypothetical protein n=1 Tax=Saccharopolyspora gloriosae TaxID=455344 RepID=UPI001FB7BE8C|nr:hypothetical protein [Saccharopolyspora gloriosae]
MAGEQVPEAVLRELYQGDPAEFVAARDRRVERARKSGDEEFASALKALRKPTTAAWAVNRVSTEQRDRVAELIEVGDELRAAQRGLRGDEIRRLDRRRAELVRELTERAADVVSRSGKALGEQARRQVESTFGAAVAEPESGRRVRAGALSGALTYSGFGLDELSVAAMRSATSSRRGHESGGRRRGRVRTRGGSGEEATVSPERSGGGGEEHRSGPDRRAVGDRKARRSDDTSAPATGKREMAESSGLAAGKRGTAESSGLAAGKRGTAESSGLAAGKRGTAESSGPAAGKRGTAESSGPAAGKRGTAKSSGPAAGKRGTAKSSAPATEKTERAGRVKTDRAPEARPRTGGTRDRPSPEADSGVDEAAELLRQAEDGLRAAERERDDQERDRDELRDRLDDLSARLRDTTRKVSKLRRRRDTARRHYDSLRKRR